MRFRSKKFVYSILIGQRTVCVRALCITLGVFLVLTPHGVFIWARWDGTRRDGPTPVLISWANYNFTWSFNYMEINRRGGTPTFALKCTIRRDICLLLGKHGDLLCLLHTLYYIVVYIIFFNGLITRLGAAGPKQRKIEISIDQD